MDKGIVLSILIAAVVSIGAALFWDKIVDTPKTIDEEQTSGKKSVGPNDNTLEFTQKNKLTEIVKYPNENVKPIDSPKPHREPKPTPTKPINNGDDSKNINDMDVKEVNDTKDRVHIVSKGETLSEISKKYYKTVKYWPFLKKYNHLPTENLDINQKLLIPQNPEN